MMSNIKNLLMAFRGWAIYKGIEISQSKHTDEYKKGYQKAMKDLEKYVQVMREEGENDCD